MAATAAAAFSTSMHSLKCLSSTTYSPNDHHHMMLKISSCPRMLLHPAASISISHLGAELNPIMGSAVCNAKWRVPRLLAAAVTQEETAVDEEEEEEEEAVEDEEEVTEDDGDGEGESGGANTKLYFGNLPYLCDSAQLAGIIQEYASPELVEVLYDRNTGKSRGFAFVTMSTVEDCNTVIQNLDGSEYGGRTLRVNFADKPKPKEPLYPETEHKLFVGNLSWSVASETLTEAFQQYGNVVGARVLYDGETGRSRGYGFVSYETRAEMEAALQALDGVELEGRVMRVSLAQGKKQ